MFINNIQYPTDMMKYVNCIREILFSTLYRDIAAIKNLENIICKYIDCSNIEFSYSDFSFRIKIKRTSMSRFKLFRFEHNPNFYYKLVPYIFSEFLHDNEYMLISELEKIGTQNPRELLSSIYNSADMSNLCIITCISDNVLLFKL